MTTELREYRSFKVSQRNKATPLPEVDNEQVQLDWIRGLVDQVEFSNRPDVLPDYILCLKIAKRRLEP